MARVARRFLIIAGVAVALLFSLYFVIQISPQTASVTFKHVLPSDMRMSDPGQISVLIGDNSHGARYTNPPDPEVLIVTPVERSIVSLQPEIVADPLSFYHRVGLNSCIPGGLRSDILNRIFSVVSYLVSYVSRQTALLKDSSSTERMILVRCVGGFGNCLNGVVTGLLLALLTNRLFFIDWSYPVHSCLGEWDYRKASELSTCITKLVRSLANGPTIAQIDDCFVDSDITRHLDIADPAKLDVMFPYPSFILLTNCPLYKHIARAPALLPKLKSLGVLDIPFFNSVTPNERYTPGFLAYGSLLRTFLSLDATLFKKVQEVLHRVTQTTMFVALQVRIGGDVIGKKDPLFMPLDYLPDVWKCVRVLASQLKSTFPPPSQVLYFLATDNVEVIDAAKIEFGGDLMLSDDIPQHGVSGAGLDKTLVDQWTMVLADTLLVTPGSTFGSAAAMISGRLPYYVEWDTRRCRVTDLKQPPMRYKTIYPAF